MIRVLDRFRYHGVCDTCGDRKPRWVYSPLPFALMLAPGEGFTSNGPWAACKFCHKLLQLRDADHLAARMAVWNGSAEFLEYTYPVVMALLEHLPRHVAPRKLRRGEKGVPDTWPGNAPLSYN